MVSYRFIYPITLTPDLDDGGFVVTSRDFPEAVTQGDSVDECLAEASDCLEEAITGRIRCNEVIPSPSDCLENEHLVTIPIQTAMRAALYLSMKESGISRNDLARQLNIKEDEINHLFDPLQESNLPLVERALSALGRQAELHVVRN